MSLNKNTTQEIKLDLNIAKKGILTEQLNESWLTAIGWAIKQIVQGLNLDDTKFKLTGTGSQIATFMNALKGEKKYFQSALKYGLNDPRTYQSKSVLARAIKNFEKETGMKWPIE